MRCLIIIPAYNESESIEGVVAELSEVTRDFEDDYDYLVINDGSTDATKTVCKRNGYNFVTLPVNLGIGSAVQTGYIYAREHGYDIAIQMDGDGQHIPSYLPALIQPIKQGSADCAIGSRFYDKKGFQTSRMRRMGIRVLCAVIRLVSRQKVTDATSGFRAVNARGQEVFVRHYARDYPEPESIVRLKLAGLTVCEVPVNMREREHGTSSINFFKSIYFMVKVTLSILLTGLESRGINDAGRK